MYFYAGFATCTGVFLDERPSARLYLKSRDSTRVSSFTRFEPKELNKLQKNDKKAMA
jgi:hypothetical protein